MSALFNFQSLLLVFLLLICTCTYIHAHTPALFDRNRAGIRGLFWKFARIGTRDFTHALILPLGERLSPYVSLCCIIMGLNLLL